MHSDAIHRHTAETECASHKHTAETECASLFECNAKMQDKKYNENETDPGNNSNFVYNSKMQDRKMTNMRLK